MRTATIRKIKRELPFVTLFSIVLSLAVASQAFGVPASNIFKYMGNSVGVTSAVPANPYNTLAQQLKEKELSLVQRETNVKQRERTLEEEYARQQTRKDYLVMILFAGMNVLTIFIAAHFYYDFKRRRREPELARQRS